MERQQLLALHHGECMGCAATLTPNPTIGRLFRQKPPKQQRYHVLKMKVNKASMIVGLASCKMLGLCGDINP